MAFTENLTVFFDPNDFGVVATIDGSEVNGILDTEYVEIETGTVSIAGHKPVFTCATADVATAAIGSVLVAETVNYTVAAPLQHDGTGTTKIILRTS